MPFSFAGEIRILSVWQFGILLGLILYIHNYTYLIIFDIIFKILKLLTFNRILFENIHCEQISGTWDSVCTKFSRAREKCFSRKNFKIFSAGTVTPPPWHTVTPETKSSGTKCLVQNRNLSLFCTRNEGVCKEALQNSDKKQKKTQQTQLAETVKKKRQKRILTNNQPIVLKSPARKSPVRKSPRKKWTFSNLVWVCHRSWA